MIKYKIVVFDDEDEVQTFIVGEEVLDFMLMFATSKVLPNLERIYSLNDVTFYVEEADTTLRIVGEA